jgi:hypothetical protein
MCGGGCDLYFGIGSYKEDDEECVEGYTSETGEFQQINTPVDHVRKEVDLTSFEDTKKG